MGAFIPPQVAENALSREIQETGLGRVHQGKVRDTYELGDNKLLLVATDRVSIFNFVLPFEIPQKGERLTAQTIYVCNAIKTVRHHIIAYGHLIDSHLPKNLQKNRNLRACALVVQKLDMIPIEFIIRGHLTGSALKKYQKHQPLCGITLPERLCDGKQFPEPFFPLFTPTTKAEEGRDEELDAKDIETKYSEIVKTARELFRFFYQLAFERGIIIADTKFEFGFFDGEIVLGDEVFTPDSSRFWDREEWTEAQRFEKSPRSLDKDIVRKWGSSIMSPFYELETWCLQMFNELDPKNPEHLAFVSEIRGDEEVIRTTMKIYEGILERFTLGFSLEKYQKIIMRI